MSRGFPSVLRVLFKALLVVVVLIVAVCSGLILWLKYDKPIPPPGTPPPGYEGRLRYPRGHISNLNGFDNIPVDLWFGKRLDGQVDTTHLLIASDYFGNIPSWHGEYAELNVVWPSLRSLSEEIEIRKKNGQPHQGLPVFKMTLSESVEGDYSFTDRKGTAPSTRCEPMVHDEARGVRYCNENRLNDKPGERWTNYWPLDESLRSPFYGKPPRFGCYEVERTDGTRFDSCTAFFSYNTDLLVQIDTHEALAVELLTDYSKLIDFLHTLEVKP